MMRLGAKGRMPRVAFLLMCGLAVASPAAAADADAPLRWYAGDSDVPVWPAAQFTAADRVQQATEGGLDWVALAHEVRGRVPLDPDGPTRPRARDDSDLAVLHALRWHRPNPISEDILSLGVEPDLPFPKAEAQEIIDWTNGAGGVAVLADPGRKLERYAGSLTGLAAFEAFHGGRWNPECLEGGAWDRLLARGERLHIVGASSDPDRPVLGRGAVATYVLARSAAEADLVAAIRAGRTVVAERDRIRLDFTVNGQPPGSKVVPEGNVVEVALRVVGREPVDVVTIIGNAGFREGRPGEPRIGVLKEVRIDAKEAVHTFTLRLHKSTRYLRAVAAIEKGATRTMTNPVFLGAGAPEPPATDLQETHVFLVTTALRELDWRDPAKARAVVERLLADRTIGPCAAMALSRDLDRRQLEAFRPLLQSTDPTVRARTAYVLVKLEGRAALPSILPLLDENAAAPRVYAARTLARFAGPEHIELALRAARDRWADVAQYGLVALARLPDARSVAALRRALAADAPTVRRAAGVQLSRMLELDPQHRKAFLEAFRSGEVGLELLETAVTRADLRPLVARAAALDLHRPDAPEPPEPGAPDEAGPVFPRLEATRAAEAPAIDGRGDDEVWAQAAPVGGFVLDEGRPAAHPTRVRALWSGEALYLLFECAEPDPDGIVANEKVYDSNVWLDDSVDVYLCPEDARDHPDPQYYRFSASAAGVRFDEERRRRHWNAPWEAAATVGEEGWTLEVALPFSSLDVRRPARGRTTWLANFVRHRRVDPEENTAFAPGDPRRPADYGELSFE